MREVAVVVPSVALASSARLDVYLELLDEYYIHV